MKYLGELGSYEGLSYYVLDKNMSTSTKYACLGWWRGRDDARLLICFPFSLQLLTFSEDCQLRLGAGAKGAACVRSSEKLVRKLSVCSTILTTRPLRHVGNHLFLRNRGTGGAV